MYDPIMGEIYTPQPRNQADAAIQVKFYSEKHPNKMKTQEMGYVVWDDKIFCQLSIPTMSGRPDIVIHEMKGQKEQELKIRFPVQWAQFQQGQEQIPEGMPLSAWAMIDAGEARYYTEVCRIITVEQLAALSDAQLVPLGGSSFRNREKAQQFIKMQSDTSETTRLQIENDKLKSRLTNVESELTELKNLLGNKNLEQLTALAKNNVVPIKKAGRPKKNDSSFDNTASRA